MLAAKVQRYEPQMWKRFRKFWAAWHLTTVISTVIAILGVVFGFFGFQAQHDQRNRELAALVANQNLAWISQRYVEDVLAGKKPIDISELATIRKAIESVNFREVIPPQLIVDFVWLWSAGQGLDNFAKAPSPSPILEVTRKAMRRINACLTETGWASINDGFAVAHNAGWFATRFSPWHHLQSEFCPKTTALPLLY